MRSLLLCIVLLCPAFVTSTFAAEQELTLKVISHNVWYGFTKKTSPRYEDWLQWLATEQPDVVALQELNGYTPQRLAENAASWGHAYSVLLKSDGFPTGITSRFPITDVKRILAGMHHGLLRCRIRGVWFYVIHFHPSNFQRRIEEVAVLQEDIQTLPDPSPRIVLAGDFNGFSPVDRERYDSDRQLHEFFAMLDRRDTAKNLNEGRIDYGGIEAIQKLGFVDTFAHDNQQNKPFKGTFPTRLVADEDHGTERRLDYIFVSNNLRGSFSHSQVIRTPVTESLSDHIPVSTILSLSVPRVFTGPPQLLQEHGAGEGPAWHPQLGLLTSGEGNINLRSLSGESNRYREQAGSNGLMFDRQGRLIVCEPVRRRVTREELDGSITVLAETFSGMRFNQPNDLTIDSQNRIYFTDPQYGDRSKMELVDDEGRVVEGVYRIDPNGNVTRIITHEVDRPNGIVITPDDAHLFVADNNNAAGGARKLWRFNLNQDGTVDPTTQRLIYDWGTTRGPDGMKLDQAGNLYVAGGLNRPNIPHETAEPATAGIYVFNNEGLLIEFVPIPRDETTNCGFGGHDWKTLFVTAGGSLWAIPTLHPGRNLFPLAPQN